MTRSDGSPATFGQRYVFSFLERSTLSAQFRLNYAFTPNFTVEAYAEPFAASGRFYDFGELPVRPCDTNSCVGSRELRTYGASGTGTSITRSDDGYAVSDAGQSFVLPDLDFNRLSFRSNLVLRWEWRPGSTAYLIWQQDRQDVGPAGRLVGPRDLWDATNAAGANFLVAKVS